MQTDRTRLTWEEAVGRFKQEPLFSAETTSSSASNDISVATNKA